MQIMTTNEAGASVIRVEGSMDAISVAEFDAEWKKVIEEGSTRVVVEMGGLEYISSAGRHARHGLRHVQALWLSHHSFGSSRCAERTRRAEINRRNGYADDCCSGQDGSS